ncbi:MAG: I78 family peptidase inhibitor [Marinovum sp.]|nr:I78 family peptidase inhibitor [Marinovum sp.]
MLKVSFLFTGAICLLLAACMETETNKVQVSQPVCAGATYQDLVGEAADSAIIIAEPKRVILPNSAVTTDHRPDRTNILLDKTGKIASITCG